MFRIQYHNSLILLEYFFRFVTITLRQTEQLFFKNKINADTPSLMSNHSAGGCFQRQRADEKGHLCSARGFYRLCKHTQLQKFSGLLLPFKKTDDEKKYSDLKGN